ncbi:MAG: SRPBCC domain-containing protein [Phycisphaerae bacterium]
MTNAGRNAATPQSGGSPGMAHEEVHVRIDIAASVETVWRFMSDGERFASWIGAFAGQAPLPGTKIEAREGGSIRIAYPGNNAAVGTITVFVPRERIAFSWGYEDSSQGVPTGSTLVEITLTEIAKGTRVDLRHSGLPTQQVRDGHRGGWTHYLSMLARNSTGAHYSEAATALAAYFAAWREADAGKRTALLENACADEVSLRSSFACTDSRTELAAHISNARQHMPGVELHQAGNVQQLHEYAQCGWAARTPEGENVFSGVAFATFGLDGRIATMVTFAGG